MPEQFVSEAIQPVTSGSDTRRMAAGGPGLPRTFLWREQTVTITRVWRAWRETGPCHHGSGEQYVRKHWYDVETDNGRMKIYFDRQPRGGPKSKRWWLFSVSSGPRSRN